MAGYDEMYVIGGQGGFMGVDGINPIELQIWVGNSSRMWFTPYYFDSNLKPLGQLNTIIPERPDCEDNILDACIAFYPIHFQTCPSLKLVEKQLGNKERLDFDISPKGIPTSWPALREEARPLFATLNIWHAPFRQLNKVMWDNDGTKPAAGN